MNTPKAYLINERYLLDPSENTIRSLSGQVQSVEPLLSELIVYLIEKAPSTVTHGQLIDRFWGPTVKGPEALMKAISKVRKLMGPEVIKTVNKKGYAWTAKIEMQETSYVRSSIKGVQSLMHRPMTLVSLMVLFIIIKAIFFPHPH